MSGRVIEIATIHTSVAATKNRIARKYRAGIIITRATGNRKTARALKPQIARAQRSPLRKESAEYTVLSPMGTRSMPTTMKLSKKGGPI